MKHWYVVYTRPQQEKIAVSHLARQQFETYFPLLKEQKRIKRKWQEVIVPLFPRYLFIKLKLETDNVAPIRSTRGVIGLVRFGTTPQPLPNGFVEHLHQYVDVDSGCHLSTKSLFTPGGFVKILEGPFAGCTGVYQKAAGKDRALLLLEFLGRSNHITMDYNQISPV